MPINVKSARHVHANDVRHAAAFAIEATHGVTRIAESVHQAVWSTLGLPNHEAPGTTRGLTGFVYRNIHHVTKFVGVSIDRALAKLKPHFDALEAQSNNSEEREATLAALNGVLGDRLAATKNVLATPMTIRFSGQALDIAKPLNFTPPIIAKTKIILFIHGLCMNDLQWHSAQPKAQQVNYETALSSELGATTLYLRYNSGLSIEENGRNLSDLLESLIKNWPLKITEITIIAHSMGGLVARSACIVGEASEGGEGGENGKSSNAQPTQWRSKLKNIIFLGTPHHGASLERFGYLLDLIFASSRFTRVFTTLTKLRSRGITDLRHGNIFAAADIENGRKSPQLPTNVNCYAIAATLAPTIKASTNIVASNLGDGLVAIPSALGQHDDKSRQLNFRKSSTRIFARTNHMTLLENKAALKQMIAWLST